MTAFPPVRRGRSLQQDNDMTITQRDIDDALADLGDEFAEDYRQGRLSLDDARRLAEQRIRAMHRHGARRLGDRWVLPTFGGRRV